MRAHYGDYTYIPSGDAALFTVTLLPEKTGRFPAVILRSPYVDAAAEQTEEEILQSYLRNHTQWLERGYAVVFQHCRGRGKSTGDCIPYVNEREDGLRLLAWIRQQPFYNGELYLQGRSYLTSVFYAISPFPDDVKGAVLSIQDCERYNICYRNGVKKIGLNGHWYINQYKAKSHLRKNYICRKNKCWK